MHVEVTTRLIIEENLKHQIRCMMGGKHALYLLKFLLLLPFPSAAIHFDRCTFCGHCLISCLTYQHTN